MTMPQTVTDTVLAAFDETASTTPDLPAVDGAHGLRTYAQVRADSLVLARAAGEPIRRGASVAFLGRRGVDFPAVTLAVLRRAGIFVPLDPEWPRARLADVVDRAGIEVAYVDTEQADLARGLGIETVVVIGDVLDGSAAPAPAAADPGSPTVVRASEPAYVMMTSGTTGPAKGVVVGHRALAHNCRALARRLDLPSGARVLQFSAATVDISLEEIYSAWAVGGVVVTLNAALRSDLAAFAVYLERYQVQVLDLPTSFWLLWLEAIERGDLPQPPACLLAVGVGSEEVPAKAIERWKRSVDARVGLFNLYGSTELAATPVVQGPLADPSADAASVGRPVEGVEVQVLDEALEPVAAGRPGQLYFSGPVLADSYLGDPRLTAAKFQPNPYSDLPGARMYATGDEGTLTADGSIQVHGRVDGLLKVRGFTVSPQRIEEVITQVDEVARAAVLLDESVSPARLTATVTLREADADDITESWREVYEAIYGQDDSLTSGWFSTVDGSPIPQPQMQSWLDDIVGKLRALSPRRVLELGCGTGMLLRELAPELERYVGVDFSREAVEYLQDRVPQLPGPVDVSLYCDEALASLGHIQEVFDLVIVNSVTQHFPDADHLREVLTSAAALTAPGGAIFIGDVRDLDRLEDFHRWVVHHRDPDRSDPAARVRESLARESELVVSPSFFAATTSLAGRPAMAQILAKYGDEANEMSLFRFDVVLRLDAAAAPAETAALPTMTWTQYLAQPEPPGGRTASVITGVVAARALGALPGSGFPPAESAHAVSFVAWREELRRSGLELVASPDPRRFGYYDVALLTPAHADAVSAWLRDRRMAAGVVRLTNKESSWDVIRSKIIAVVMATLPEHERPAEYRLADRVNGMAPEAVPVVAADHHDHRAAAPAADPRAVEEALAEIWRSVLGDQHIASDDDFFELGGNSLHLTRVLVRIQSTLGIRISGEDFFASPTIGRLAALVNDRRRSGALAVAAQPVRSDRSSGPASFAQERLWLINALFPQSPAYNAPFAFDLDGPLDVAALKVAALLIVRRHETLRTTVEMVDGVLAQTITDHAPLVAEITVAGTDTAGPPDTEERDFIVRPFDLAGESALRVGWRAKPDGRFRLVFVVHHIAFDELSINVFFDDFATAYNAALAGEEPAFGPMPIRYLDYSSWERECWQAADENQALRERWAAYLDSAPTLLDFPGDRRRELIPSGLGDRQELDLPAALATELASLARREGVTPYQLWLGLFSLFLSNEAGSRDLVIGVPSENRTIPDLDQVVGFFVNTLPVRMDLRSNPTVSEVVREAARSVLFAQSGQAMPFQLIAEAAGVVPDLGHNPLFQSMVVLEPPSEIALALDGRPLDVVDLPELSSTVDLSLIVRPRDGLFTAHFCYSTDLFDDATMRRMGERFVDLLRLAADDPDLRASDFNRGGESVVHGPRTDVDMLVPLHLQIRDTAAASPDALAVVDGDERYTFRQLVDWADRIAETLAPVAAAGPVVPLVLDAGAAVIASMLAVNSLGLAFVPVDPTWPTDRIDLILRDVGADFYVVAASQAAEVGAVSGRPVVVSAAGEPSVAGRTWLGGLDDVMSVIYTSGSTGRPKGAMNRHRGIANRCDWMTTEMGAEARSRVLQTTAPYFDSFVWESLWPLAGGGTCVISPVSLQVDPVGLAKAVAEHRITALDMAPALFRRLLEHLAGDDEARSGFESVRVAVVGGEEMTPAISVLLERLGPGLRVYNLYGPTEAAIGSVYHPLRVGEPLPVPIGRPLQNTGALILDEMFRPVPIGVRGELYLTGVCVGAGYVGNAHASRSRFLETAEHGRIYRTGDLARLRRDGEIEYFGRLDGQVKVNGVRAELAEVTSALSAVPGVADAVVVAMPANPPGTTDGGSPGALAGRFADALRSPDPQRRASAVAILELLEHETSILEGSHA